MTAIVPHAGPSFLWASCPARPLDGLWLAGPREDLQTPPMWHASSTATGTGETPSDDALIRAALSRDDNSFAALVERYEGAVTAVLWHFTRDRVLLEELVQETFVEAFFSLRRFRKGAPFYPWLRTIATRTGYRYWRRQQRDRHRESLLGASGAWPVVQEAAPSDTAEYVFKILEQLPPKDRLVLTLQYFEGCNTREIAARTGWTLPVVKVRSFRARKRLKELLLETELASHENR
jgi:RNA polymerase sigma-70 factor, ECF subfamily